LRLFDTHTHLNMRDFSRDLPQVLRRAQSRGVEKFLCVGYNFRSSAESVAFAQTVPFVWAAVGVHPHDAKTVLHGDYTFLEDLRSSANVVAWGEIGLDYYRDLSPRPLQQEVFRAQIRAARQAKLPIIVHERDAHADLLRILEEEQAKEVGGVLHCFSASWNEASQALDLGFYLSFAGNVTYPASHAIREVAIKAPADRILVETDCPYLKPLPDRKGRNEPAFVRSVLEFVANLRGEPAEDLAVDTWENAHRLLGLAT
jgi:TatD DNase family protein